MQTAPSNDFPPTWIQVEEELGVEHLLGERLGVTVREIFARNQITPSVAATEIEAVFAELQSASTQLDQLVAAMGHFRIGAEELKPGKAEVDVLIPRPAVGNRLDELGQEFIDLQRLLGPFLELGTGSRPAVEVATISSSDFGVFLDVARSEGRRVHRGRGRADGRPIQDPPRGSSSPPANGGPRRTC